MRRRTARRRRGLLAALLLAALALAAEHARPPEARLTTRAALAAIDLYQETFSGRLGWARGRCRFKPTCSLYGEVVIRRDGALVGGAKTFWRILRCGPWTPLGTVDPPEPASPAMRTPAGAPAPDEPARGRAGYNPRP